MIELTPITNLEYEIQDILDGELVENPITRIEQMLEDISNYRVVRFAPITRIEQYLANISGYGNAIPQPFLRIEFYLAAICGMNVILPTPETRLEYLLLEWYEHNEETITIAGEIATFIAQKAVPIKELVVSFSPQQDLHGQPAPYPAGGGKNKFDVQHATFKKWRLSGSSIETYSDDSTVVTFTQSENEVSFSNTLSYAGIGIVIDAVDYDRVASLASDIGGAIQLWSAYEAGATRISTGATSCSIPANTSGFLALRHDVTGSVTAKVQIESDTIPSSWSPYSNICPITGYTGATAIRTGQNLAYDITDREEGKWIYGYSSINAGVPKINVPLKAGDYNISMKVRKPPDETANIAFGSIRYWFKYADGSLYPVSNSGIQFLPNTYYSTPIPEEWTYIERTISVPQNATEIYFGFYHSGKHAEYDELQVALATETGDYEEPQGTTVSVSWQDEAGTVYSGTYDFVSGVGNSDKDKYTFTGNETWNYYSSSPSFFYCSISSGLTSIGKRYTAENGVELDYDPASGQVRIYLLYNSFITSDTNVSELMANIGFLYEKAQATTFTLTPQQIDTLVGLNNVWADIGDVSVTIPEYIDITLPIVGIGRVDYMVLQS